MEIKNQESKEKYGYIYVTENLINGKKYVGQHKAKEFEPNKYLGSGLIFRKALELYGKQSFKCTLIEWCYSYEELNERENYWIKYYNAVEDPKFYNLIDNKNGPDEEAIENIKLNNVGKHKRSEEEAKAMGVKISNTKRQRNIKLGPFTEEHILKKSNAILGINNPNYGIKFSKEWASKISEGKKGKPHIIYKVKCIEDNLIFKSASAAAKHYGLIADSLRTHLKKYGIYKFNNKTFIKMEGEENK